MNSGTEFAYEPLQTPEPRLSPRTAQWPLWVAGATYLLICLFVQWRVHAEAAAFGTYPDEPAHYIGGLLIRDYAESGMSQSPLSFAKDYYKQVPFFGIGYWPPVFYCIEAAWVFLFGPGRSGLLLLSALFAAASAAFIFDAIRGEAGVLAGACGGLLFLSAPEIQRQICTTMVDLPVCFGALAATLFAVRYIQSERWTDAIGFAVASSAAFLTKYSAAYVCVIPFLMAVLFRRWRLLRSASFWIQPAIVLALVGPWLFLTQDLARQLMELDFVGVAGHARYSLSVRLGLFLNGLFATLPWPAWVATGIGLSTWMFRWSRWRAVRVAFVIHFAALLAFLIASSVWNERRYFTAGIAAMIIAGLCGWKRLEQYWPRAAPAALVGFTLLAVVLGAWIAPGVRANDFDAVVQGVVAEARWRDVPVFVASDAEGPMIAEFAMRDPSRPKRRLIRPGKVLASDNWFGANYKCLYETPAEVQSLMADLQVGVVILPKEQASDEKPHETLLRQAIRGRPDLWRRALVGSRYEVFEAAHRL